MFGLKKKATIILLILSILVLSFLVYPKSEKYNSLINENQINQIIETKTYNSDLRIEELSFDENPLVLAEFDNLLLYSLVEGSDSAYNPEVELKSTKKANIIFDQEITDSVITNNKSIKAIIYNNDSYNEYIIKCTTLPVVSISTSNSYEKETEETRMDFFLFDNSKDTIKRNIDTNGFIRIRGNTSSFQEKCSYRLKFGEKGKDKLSLLGMRRDGEYILNPNALDNTMIRNVFCSRLWNESCANNNIFGIDNGYELKYVELIKNGSYSGLYSLGYKVSEETVDLKDGEFLYKKAQAIENETYSDYEPYIHYDYEVVAGYRVENDTKSANRYELLVDYLKLINNPESSEEEILKTIDLDNIIDIFLFINATQQFDTYLTIGNQLFNLYITFKNTNDGYICLYTLWDMDTCFGSPRIGNSLYDPKENCEAIVLPIYHLIKEDEDLKEKLIERYDELRKDYWSDSNLLKMLNQCDEEVFGSGAYYRDYERWTNDFNNFDRSYIDTGLNPFKEYVLERFKYMDLYIDGLR